MPPRAQAESRRHAFQRLNRAEYAQSVHDMLRGLDIDVETYLPPDTISHNFDNIADAQSMSATLLEGYMRAASQVSRLAVGDPEASPGSTIYKIPRMASQLAHAEGAPFGTRGGISVVHNFPADGDYVFRMMLHRFRRASVWQHGARRRSRSRQRQRVALIEINPRMSESDPAGMNLQTPSIAVKRPQRVSAAFIQRSEAVRRSLAPVEHDAGRHPDRQLARGDDVAAPPRVRGRARSA
jgi:hypothetical protein